MLSERDFGHEVFQERTETRYVVPTSSLEQIKTALMTSGFKPIIYTNPAVRNVHFTSPKLKAPSGGYVRFRKYIPADQLVESPFTLSPDDDWFLEIKPSERPKERISLQSETAFELLNERRSELFVLMPASVGVLESFDERLIPIAVSQWQRTHFVSEDSQTRITIDESIGYFGFRPGETYAMFMGRQDNIKIEIKRPLGSTGKDVNNINLSDLNARQITNNWQEMEMRQRYSLLFLNK